MPGGFSIQTTQVQFPCRAHSHSFLELAYIKSGWTLHTINSTPRRLSAGDFVLVDFGQVHSYEQGSADLTVVNCLFQPVMVDPALGHCRSFSRLLNSCVPGIAQAGALPESKLLHDDSGQVFSILQRMEQEMFRQEVGYLPLLRALLMELLVQIIRQTGLQTPCCPGVEVGWILEEISRSPAQAHSLCEYAQRFRMRPEALSRMFCRQTGEKFSVYLRHKRMELACRLLLETDKSVPQIAECCGYFDGKAFREAFHRETGLSPREYRVCNGGKMSRLAMMRIR